MIISRRSRTCASRTDSYGSRVSAHSVLIKLMRWRTNFALTAWLLWSWVEHYLRNRWLCNHLSHVTVVYLVWKNSYSVVEVFDWWDILGDEKLNSLFFYCDNNIWLKFKFREVLSGSLFFIHYNTEKFFE